MSSREEIHRKLKEKGLIYDKDLDFLIENLKENNSKNEDEIKNSLIAAYKLNPNHKFIID